jgi:hypothetical protein
MGFSALASAIRRDAEEEERFVNESMADVLRIGTLATLMAVPEMLDAKAVVDGMGGKPDEAVEVSSQAVQKKLYDIIGKDRYEDFVLVNVIARTLMSECVGEKERDSFDAVAAVIWNRAGGDKSRILDVIFAPRQFSGWNKMTDSDFRNFDVRPHAGAASNPSAWKYCVDVAKSMVNGMFKPRWNWKYFYAHNKVTPYWAKKLTDKKVIGNHTFGNI